MMKPKILLSLLIISLLTACGSQKTVVKKYYMIELPSEKTDLNNQKKPAVDAWCEVDEVKTYPAFDTRKIVFRDDSHQIRFFGNHEWAVRPTEVLTPAIIDYLSTQGVFTRVSGRFWETAPSYRVETTLFNIEIGNNENNDFEAFLRLRFNLIDIKTDTIVVSHNVNRRSVLEHKDLNMFAAEVSEIFQEELNQFATKIMETIPEGE